MCTMHKLWGQHDDDVMMLWWWMMQVNRSGCSRQFRDSGPPRPNLITSSRETPKTEKAKIRNQEQGDQPPTNDPSFGEKKEDRSPQ